MICCWTELVQANVVAARYDVQRGWSIAPASATAFRSAGDRRRSHRLSSPQDTDGYVHEHHGGAKVVGLKLGIKVRDTQMDSVRGGHHTDNENDLPTRCPQAPA